MSNSNSNTNSNRKRFAADAVARMQSGQMTDAEERSIESWLQADSEHRVEFQKMLDVWDKLGDVSGVINADEIVSQAKQVPISKNKGWFIGIAASLLALPLLIHFISGSGYELKRYETAIGEVREIELVDGSQVTMNTNTAMLVDFTETRRRIILSRGEAFFDIEKDPARPLTVSVGDRTITVLGTSFNVNWDGSEVTVAVVEGRVAVQPDGVEPTAVEHLIHLNDAALAEPDSEVLQNGIVLLAGDVAQISRKSAPVITAVSQNTERYQSWRFGYIRFDNEPLSTVIEEINRYSSTRLVIEAGGVADMRVSGVFRTADIDNAISNLELIFPIKVLNRDGHYLIVSAHNLGP